MEKKSAGVWRRKAFISFDDYTLPFGKQETEKQEGRNGDAEIRY